MLQLIGGNIRFVGVHFYLEITEPLTSGCWLFDLKQVKNIKFEDCTITIRNDHDATASFIYVAGGPSRIMPDGMPPSLARSRPTISLTSCVVRGQANLVRAVEGLPFRLDWQQGFRQRPNPQFTPKAL
jgi:hypothetical protein